MAFDFSGDLQAAGMVGRFPSVEDIDAQRSQTSINRLHALLLGNDLENAPLHRQQLELALQTGQIGNEKARALLTFLRKFSTRGQSDMPLQDPTASGPTQVPSQWSPGGAQGPALAAGAPPVALPVPNTPQPPPQGAQGVQMPPPVGSRAPGIGGMGADDLVAFHALGGPDLLPSLKMLTEGVGHAPGSEVTSLRDGSVHTVPTLDKGQRLENGRISTIPGYDEATAGTAGAVARATEGAKAGVTPLDPKFVGRDGNPVGGTVGQYVGLPQPGAPGAPGVTPPSPMDQFSPDQQRAIVQDMLKQGKDPSTALFNGAPAHADEQQQLDAAKAAGPAGLQRLAATWLPKIQAIPDPATRDRALKGFMADLGTPAGTPIHSMGPAPAAAPSVAGQGAPRLAGPAQLAGEDTEARKVQERFSKYNEDLDTRVEQGFGMLRRNAELKANLEQFQAGLAGGHLRSDLASNLANAFPDNPRIQSLAGAIVGGGPDAPAAAQTFNSLVAGAMIANAIQVLDGKGRLNQGEVQAFKAASESAQTDPRALARIMGIQNRYAEQDLAEQQALAAARRNGTFDARTWTADWAKQRREMMRDPNSPFAPESASPMEGSRDPRTHTSPSGKRFTVVGGE